jgi:hypothetical protein
MLVSDLMSSRRHNNLWSLLLLLLSMTTALYRLTLYLRTYFFVPDL